MQQSKKNTSMRDKISRALAGTIEDAVTKVLIKWGASALEYSARRPLMIQMFTNDNCWGLIDPLNEPLPPVPVLGAPIVDPRITKENVFDDLIPIDIDGVIKTKLGELRGENQNSFQAQLDAVPAATVYPGNAAAQAAALAVAVASGTAWTAIHVRTAKSAIKAQKARALMQINKCACAASSPSKRSSARAEASSSRSLLRRCSRLT
jgi:hypothetical protein